MVKAWFRLAGFGACLTLAGCANIAYYAQAIEGQARLMAAAQPIPELIADPATDATLRRQLEQVRAVRAFASSDLGLPDNRSYHSYARLGRPYVVWNVFATPEFSMAPKRWCMLFVGCLGYRGYFDEHAAETLAAELRQGGYDTYVGGVPAYSTLGYFNDPVLDTFLSLGDQEVARIIFHELAHQRVFVAGDTAFNESFAVTVEGEGLHRWLAATAGPAGVREYEARESRKAQFLGLIAEFRDRLETVYTSSLSADEMARAKVEAFADMRRAYARLKSEWHGYAGYDRWFAQPLNNAVLASVALYTRWVPAFRVLLAQEHGDLPTFYRRVAELAKLPKAARADALDRLEASSEIAAAVTVQAPTVAAQAPDGP